MSSKPLDAENGSPSQLGFRISSGRLTALRAGLLAWYEAHRRDLPWRRTGDPYAIWVSEIMLQQTRVAAVLDRYDAFLRAFPTIQALADASEPEVLALWSGLGYYRRARNLLRAAKVIAKERAGVLPSNAAGLRELPGIGAYTSAAIASIAFGEPTAVVDGNVERVMQRLAGWGAGSDRSPANLARNTVELANILLDSDRPGDFNQAMMELGATVCLPRNPQCLLCPLEAHCQTRGEHPTAPRTRMQTRNAACALVTRRHGEILLQQRPSSETVMPGMWELPPLLDPELPAGEHRFTLRHAIMQVNYRVRVCDLAETEVEALAVPSSNRRWIRLNEAAALPLTGLARKILLRAGLLESNSPEPGPTVLAEAGI